MKMDLISMVCVQTADKLEAWAEAHHAAAMRCSDAEYVRQQQNIRDNYLHLVRDLRAGIADHEKNT